MKSAMTPMMTLDDYLIRVHRVNLAWDRTEDHVMTAAEMSILALSAAVWVFSIGSAPDWVLSLMLLPMIGWTVLMGAPPSVFWNHADLRAGLACSTCGESLFRTQGRGRV